MTVFASDKDRVAYLRITRTSIMSPEYPEAEGVRRPSLTSLVAQPSDARGLGKPERDYELVHAQSYGSRRHGGRLGGNTGGLARKTDW